MPRQTVTESKLTSPFLMEDLLHGVKALKNNKAAGLDDMLCEQIKQGYSSMVTTDDELYTEDT